MLQDEDDAHDFLEACFRRPDDPPDDGEVARRATCDDLARTELVFRFLNNSAAEE